MPKSRTFEFTDRAEPHSLVGQREAGRDLIFASLAGSRADAVSQHALPGDPHGRCEPRSRDSQPLRHCFGSDPRAEQRDLSTCGEHHSQHKSQPFPLGQNQTAAGQDEVQGDGDSQASVHSLIISRLAG